MGIVHNSDKIDIVSFQPEYREAFKKLNEDWIRQYFRMEELDYLALDHPETYIINKGGYIAVALENKKPIGVCALIKLEQHSYDYELAKMGVAPEAQGKGIGYQLGLDIIRKAKELGGRNLFLESNTVLEPAIALYKKLGFEELKGAVSPYERSNIQMALHL